MYPLHKDDRGSFQELTHADDVEFGQLSLLTVNPSCVRGGHYHKRKQEWFCCIRGICQMEITGVKSGTKVSILLDENNKAFIKIHPYESHSVRNMSDKNVCDLLVIASEEYNPNDDDTFKWKDDAAD